MTLLTSLSKLINEATFKMNENVTRELGDNLLKSVQQISDIIKESVKHTLE